MNSLCVTKQWLLGVHFGAPVRVHLATLGVTFEAFWGHFCTLEVIFGALWAYFLCSKTDWGVKGRPRLPQGRHPGNPVTLLDFFWDFFWDMFTFFD